MGRVVPGPEAATREVPLSCRMDGQGAVRQCVVPDSGVHSAAYGVRWCTGQDGVPRVYYPGPGYPAQCTTQARATLPSVLPVFRARATLPCVLPSSGPGLPCPVYYFHPGQPRLPCPTYYPVPWATRATLPCVLLWLPGPRLPCPVCYPGYPGPGYPAQVLPWLPGPGLPCPECPSWSGPGLPCPECYFLVQERATLPKEEAPRPSETPTDHGRLDTALRATLPVTSPAPGSLAGSLEAGQNWSWKSGGKPGIGLRGASWKPGGKPGIGPKDAKWRFWR